MHDFDVVIAGAGIVGTSAALWAQMRGHRVLLCDPAPPGSGASSGNACTLATYACLPVNDPSVFTSLPSLLFSKNSPLGFSYRYALRHPRWMLAFLANCTGRRSRTIAGHLAGLLSHADAGLAPLIAEAGAEDLIVERGQLSLWSTASGARAAQAGLDLRRRLGISLQELSPAEARKLEPGITLPIERAVYYPEARHVRDPEALVRRFHARFTALGGETRAEAVSALAPRTDGVEVTIGSEAVQAGHAVISAGAYAKTIAGAGTESIPLGTERGYHLMFPDETDRITRPVGWAEGGFYAVPMGRGLRLAGTVEIAERDAPVNDARLAYLARRGAELLGPLPAPASHWLGRRPTLPDALPVIGRTRAAPRMIHAFGHQHLGLTLGGISGRIVADLVGGPAPNIDLAPFAPDRRFIVK
ncbi:MAG: amino acid dehydrogenase [Rhodobacterales bacterium]|nr:MAG: amino acid dehydrogenase [Rhodobacterales bacterium]